MRDKPQRWLPLLLGVIAWLLICAPVLAPGMQLGERDTARLYYPIKRFVAEQWSFWDPQAEGGLSLLGQVTPGLLHPLSLLYLLPFDFAFKCNHLVALFLGGLGVYWLARQRRCSWRSSLAGALVFGGSGALVSAASSNLPYALGPATVPLAIAALHWWLDSPSYKRLLGASWLLAMCAYAGDPQSFGLAIGIGLAWRWRSFRRVAIWAACGLILAAPVALPALVQLQRSARSAGLNLEEQQSFASSPARLFGLLVPIAFDAQEPEPGQTRDTFSEYFAGPRNSTAFLTSILLGAPALLLAFAAGRKALFPTCAALVLIAASTGALQPLSFGLFRYAEKFLLPASWLLALSAAIGAEQLERIRRPALVLAGFSIVVTATVFAAHGNSALARQLASNLERGLLETAALSLLLAFGARWAPALCAILPLLHSPLVAVDVELLHGTSSTGRKALELSGPSQGQWRLWVDSSGKLLTPASLEPHAARLLAGREALLPQLQALDGIDGLAPYFSATDAHFLEALRESHEQMFALFGVSIEIDRSGNEPKSESGYSLLQTSPKPRAFVVHEARVGTSLRGMNVFREALVDSQPLHFEPSQAEIELRRPSPSKMLLEVRSSTPGLLVVAEHFDPGWSASLDGAAVAVEEVDRSALGVRLPAGGHHVELRFFPRLLAPGLALAALLTLALLLLSRRPVK